MDDLDRVRAALSSGALLHPIADVPSTVDLAIALGCLAGVPHDPTPGARKILERTASGREQPEHTVFVLVDGLGYNLVESLPADALLRRQMEDELRAVFPSTTAAALTSLTTARWPADHAVTGWFTHLPDQGCTALILPFVERESKQPLIERGVTPEAAFPLTAQTAAMTADAHHYQPNAINVSVYSAYQRGPAIAEGYETLAEAVESISGWIAAAAGPTYHYWYIPDVDAGEHRYGHEAIEVREELLRVQAAIEALAENLAALPRRCRLVVSADHGMLTVQEDAKHNIAPDDPLLHYLELPFSGEPRVPMFHVKQNRASAFEAEFRARFGDDFALLTAAQTEELHLFGPGSLSPTTRSRIGDYVAIALGASVLLYQPDILDRLRGFHAGLTPQEMRIPLIVI